MIGRKFGKLTVLEQVGNDGHGNSKWKCICDCGGIKIATRPNLRTGNTKTCGCIRAETNKKISQRLFKGLGVTGFNYLYKRYQISANSRNIKFNLSEIEFENLTSNNCFYCGIEPYLLAHGSTRSTNEETIKLGTYIYNGVDRVDNHQGYVPDNCVSCCEKCNRMKLKLSKEIFLDQIEKIYNHVKTKINT